MWRHNFEGHPFWDGILSHLQQPESKYRVPQKKSTINDNDNNNDYNDGNDNDNNYYIN